MTKVNAAANAVNPTPGPAEAGIIKAVELVAKNAAHVFGFVADALPMPLPQPGIGGLYGFLASNAKKLEEAKSWESLGKYLEMQIKLESGKPENEKSEVRLDLLKTASGGVFRRHTEFNMGNCNPGLRDSATNVETDAALEKLGFIMNPETFAEDAQKMEVEVLKWEIGERTLKIPGQAAKLEFDRIALEQDQKDFAGVEKLSLLTLQSDSFDKFKPSEDPVKLETAIKEKGMMGQYKLLQEHCRELKEGLKLEKPDSEQAKLIKKAMVAFKPFSEPSPGGISMKEACEILSKVRAKLASPAAKNYAEYRSKSIKLDKRAEEIESRTEELRTFSWSITRLSREVADLELLLRTSEHARNHPKFVGIIGGAIEFKPGLGYRMEGEHRLPTFHEATSIGKDHLRVKEMVRMREKPKR